MELLSPELLLVLLAAGAAAGFVDSVAGGGGLLALPTLLAVGLDPAQALATNKLQGSFGTGAAVVTHVRRGSVSLLQLWFPILCTGIGAALGTLTVQRLDPGLLSTLIPVLLIGFALYFLFSPRVGDLDAQRRVGEVAFGLVIGFGVGFYDGFFGPGAGVFFALGHVALLGHNLRRATAHTKVLNFTSNIASLAFFAVGGNIVWAAGLVMGCGQYLGAWLGSHLVLRHGAALVRPMLVSVSLVISARLLWQQLNG